MEHLKLTLYMLLMFASLSEMTAQPLNRLKTLYFVGGTEDETFYDSVVIHKSTHDTTLFTVVVPQKPWANYSYRQEGKKIYGEDRRLVYDFGLEKGDTFFFDYYESDNFIDTLLIDTIYTMRFGHRTHRVWRLETRDPNLGSSFAVEWVEGLGSLEYGWNYFRNTMDFGINSIARCIHDSLIYVDSAFAMAYPAVKTCNFDAFSMALSLGKDISVPEVNLYPVPAGDELNIAFNGTYTARVEVMNLFGQVLVCKDFDMKNVVELQLPHENSALLVLRITGPEISVIRKITRLR